MLRRSTSTSTNNHASPPGPDWRSTRDYDGSSHTPNPNESNYGRIVSYSQSHRAIPGLLGDSAVVWEKDNEFYLSQCRSVPSYDQPFYRVPSQHRTPVQLMILDGPGSPRPTEHHHTRPIPRAAEQRSGALESLTKELYNPNSKRLIRSVNLYYRDTPVKPHELDDDEDGKRCSVCLEDFERGQEVMLTPCKHMFHEDCIVPWAASNPHCPVCRFALGTKATERSPGSGFNGGRSGNGAVNHGLTNQEFLSILRALGDGFEWGY